MARTKTVDRIKTLLSIPTGDLVEIAPDIWAVKPLWLDDIIAAYPAQSTYQAWIAKGYKATLVNLNTTGFKCYVVNRDGDSNAASLAMRMLEQERMPFSANGNGGSGTHLPGIVYASVRAIVGTTAGGSGPYVDSTPLNAEIVRQKALGHYIGADMTMNFNIPQRLDLSAGPVANVSARPFIDWTIDDMTVYEAVPSSTIVDWPLIVGPSVLTRAEFYYQDSTLEHAFVACKNGDMADYMEPIIDVIPVQSDKINAQSRLAKMRSLPNDASYMLWKPVAANVFEYYPQTAPHATEMWAKTGTDGDIDYDAAHDIWEATPNAWLFGVAGGEADLALINETMEEVPAAVEYAIQEGGGIIRTHDGVTVALDDFANEVRIMRIAGRTVTVIKVSPIDYGTLPAGIVNVVDAVIASLDDPIPPLGTLLSADADSGGYGLALISAGISPMSTSSKNSVGALLRGSYLDYTLNL
jgi:hypothetical protein